jgi:NitT/TauT family transport system permease protein
MAVIAIWQLIASTKLFGRDVAGPWTVIHVFTNGANRSVLLTAVRTTTWEAVRGFLWGTLFAVVCGVVVLLVPPLRRGFDQLATIESAIPLVALAPIVLALVNRSTVPTAMAAATVFFTIYIATVAGLYGTSRTHLDVFSVLGSSRWQLLRRAQIPTAVPMFATGLKVAVPLAIVGAIIGEWFGSNGGIGPVLLVSMQSYEVPMMWAAMSAAVIIAMLLFAVMAAVELLATRRFGSAT